MSGDAVLVTGAAGFVGWHVVGRLLASGWRVIGVDSFDPFYDRRTKERGLVRWRECAQFRFVEADVRDRARMTAELAGVAAVVHLAARPGVRASVVDPVPYRLMNVDGTGHLLEACQRAGVRRFVFASSSAVYGRGSPLPFREDAPLGPAASPYAATKLAGERMVTQFAHAQGARAAVLRLFSVYGPRQRPDLAITRFTGLLRAGKPVPVYGKGDSSRDYTHAADVASGVGAALAWTAHGDAKSGVFNLGSGHPVRLDSLLSTLADLLGVRARVDRRPAHEADLVATWADTAKASAELGFVPRIRWDVGLADFVSWYERGHGYESSSAA